MWDINAVTGSNDTNVTMNLAFRAGPFDIQRGGGGWSGIFPRDKLLVFSSLVLHKLFFSLVNCNKFFYFFFFEKNNALNQKNVNESNTLNEKVQKP